MRRPAQHTRPRLAGSGWAHPYTGLPGIAVFYNDGGQPPAAPPAPPAPSPADLAARGQQPPAPQPVIDRDTGVAMTQDRFNKLMTRQYQKSRDAAYREIAESLGLSYDPKAFDADFDAAADSFKATLKEGQDARQRLLTDEQRSAQELAQKEQALQSDRDKVDQEKAAIAEERRALAREQALTRLGALDTVDDQGNVTAPNLQDALAMLERDLRATPDADASAVAQAADALKKRRPELFGAAPAPQVLPPAPSGGPAAGNAPRQPAAGKDAVKEEARRWADKLGYGGSTSAA
ncbi:MULTISPECIES: hypothetical protein [unclassified Streptomyces]|uniref:hypothetical protein n=1 Tax=unclassified Streptomyces TaxID=2593676 RepID=UPI0036E66A27